MLKVEMAYLESAYITQPPLIDFKHAYRVIGLRHQCNPIKIKSVKLEIECISVNPTQEGEMTYHRCARAVQPLVNPSKGCLKGHRPRRQCGRMKIAPVMVKIERLNDKTAREDGKAHLEHIRTAQPPANNSKCLYEVVGPRRLCGRIKIAPTNVS